MWSRIVSSSVVQDAILKIGSYLKDRRYYLIIYLQDTFKKYLIFYLQDTFQKYFNTSRYFTKILFNFR